MTSLTSPVRPSIATRCDINLAVAHSVVGSSTAILERENLVYDSASRPGTAQPFLACGLLPRKDRPGTCDRTIARVDVAMKHTLEVRQDAAEEPRPDEPRVSPSEVTKSATPSCPTRDLWTRCSWMRNLARRLPSVRPEALPLVSLLSSPCSTSPIACEPCFVHIFSTLIESLSLLVLLSFRGASYWEGYKKMPRFLSIVAFEKTPLSSTNVTNIL
ncbi:hypothetical protein PRIPAC_93868 [Pristionchus pacificus]|uniref:Uncharacterized protein n=1 Tax=Pristionchus pacificus TaxID=54126 RepID=A0A2A6CHG6_PRIPA|nr:hypothetical protein PRIPAC_93868 [Pristionchus pacificus]|eukprot:PDM77530.1 hypothetical protein PRIPAC_34397 [Pristionchus pacificus]